MGTVTSGSRHGHIKITSGTHRDRREHGEIIARSLRDQWDIMSVSLWNYVTIVTMIPRSLSRHDHTFFCEVVRVMWPPWKNQKQFSKKIIKIKQNHGK